MLGYHRLRELTGDWVASVSSAGSYLIAHLRARDGGGAPRAAAQEVSREISRSLRRDPWIGLAVATGQEGIPAAARLARDAARLASKAWSPPVVATDTDVLLLTAIDAQQDVQARLAGLLDPLSRTRQETATLLESLDVFIANDLSTAAAARALDVHRHTLEYRLSKAEKLLGRSVRHGPDRLLVEAALLARRMIRAESGRA